MRANPLVPGPPPRYVMGGMGTPLVWTYHGRTITTVAAKKEWRASWIEPEEENMQVRAWGRDEQEALANARYKIDLYLKELTGAGEYHFAESLVQHVMDWMHDHTDLKPTRANVARQLKITIDDVRKKGKSQVTAAAPFLVDAFEALPLDERSQIIDEVIDFQIRSNQWEPERLPNPIRRRIEELDRKNRLLALNPPSTGVLPVIKRGEYPQMILGTVGRTGVYRYRGWELEVLKNVDPKHAPTLWDVNAIGPRGQEYFGSSNEGYDGALCHGKIGVDLKEAVDALQLPERTYLLTTWSDIATIAHSQAREGRLPTRATVARAIAEGRRQAGARGQAPRWQWFDALPLGDRVQMIDDKMEQLYCTHGQNPRNWP